MSISAISNTYKSAATMASGAGAAASVGKSVSGGDVVTSVISAVPQVANILSSDMKAEDKAQYTKETIGLAVADLYTFGLASKAYGLVDKYFPGVTKALRKFSKKFDPVIRIIGKLFGSKERFKTEGKEINKLIEQGINIQEELRGATKLTKGRSKEELIDHTVAPDFVGKKEDGSWVNNKFATSRDVKDLKAEDIWGYSAFFKKFGNDWLGKFSEEKRREIAQKALDAGAVKEGRGTITINWTPELEKVAAK